MRKGIHVAVKSNSGEIPCAIITHCRGQRRIGQHNSVGIALPNGWSEISVKYPLVVTSIWLQTLLTLLGIIVFTTLLIWIFNKGAPNHLLVPILQYGSLFALLWQDNPLGALQFIVTKSLFSITHLDPRSNLKLWTYEVDSLTLLVYLASAGLFVISLRRYRQAIEYSRYWRSLPHAVVAAVLLCAGFTYMTAIDHCAGPTWVGFVALYGLGFNEFELYPIYQSSLVIGGGLLAVWVLFSLRNPLPKTGHSEPV